jgi:CRISPR-associated protein Csd1
MEVAQVSLNTESSYTPYVLGRLFSVLEGIQKTANPKIDTTIKDRYFSAACATPAATFPILLRLSNSHLKKIKNTDAGKAVYWSKQIGEMLEHLGMDFPVHQSLQEQGAFILGYYHQTQKHFEKKTNNNKEEE